MDDAVECLRAHGWASLGIQVDVADASALDRAAMRVARELGLTDAWVSNAMTTVVAPADVITVTEYACVTATRYLSQVHGALIKVKRLAALAGRR